MGLGEAWRLLLESRKLGKSADRSGHWPYTGPSGWGRGGRLLCSGTDPSPWGPPVGRASPVLLMWSQVALSAPRTENKLEKNEESVLLSWEMYLKESYLQSLQDQQRQRPEQKMQDISNRCGRPGHSPRALRQPTDRAPGGGPAPLA